MIARNALYGLFLSTWLYSNSRPSCFSAWWVESARRAHVRVCRYWCRIKCASCWVGKAIHIFSANAFSELSVNNPINPRFAVPWRENKVRCRVILLRSKAWFRLIDARSLSPLRARVLLLTRQTGRSGIFIGCKGRRFTIHKSVYSAQVVLPRFLHPGYIHYPFRGLCKGGHWHAFSLFLSPSLECLWDLQVTLPVTPRKLGLTTLTGPNCFLPAIRPWPILHTCPRKIPRFQLHVVLCFAISSNDLNMFLYFECLSNWNYSASCISI